MRNPRSHGFYRFFTFESLLALILLNLVYWLREPFSAMQIISWLLLTLSSVLAVQGFYLLYVSGKPVGGFEHTTTLVKRGVYKYIRHPLYASLLWLGWGVFFKDPSLIGGILVLAVSASLIATAKAEEAENLRRFGADYASYMKSTRRFIPFLF